MSLKFYFFKFTFNGNHSYRRACECPTADRFHNVPYYLLRNLHVTFILLLLLSQVRARANPCFPRHFSGNQCPGKVTLGIPQGSAEAHGPGSAFTGHSSTRSFPSELICEWTHRSVILVNTLCSNCCLIPIATKTELLVRGMCPTYIFGASWLEYNMG